MPTLAAVVVLVDELDRVLLTRRMDFDVWCLPGGVVEDGESLEEAALRELAEEVGAVQHLDRFVGIYSEIGGWSDMHVAAFMTRAPLTVGSSNAEVREVAWFPVDALPADMFWWNRQYIADTVHGLVGIARRMDLTCRLGPVSRAQLYSALSDYDGTPSEFFHWCFPAPTTPS